MLVCILNCSHIRFLRASWNCGIAFLNMLSMDDMFHILLLILSGKFWIVFGWWLLCLCTYNGMLFRFMYGLCSLDF